MARGRPSRKREPSEEVEEGEEVEEAPEVISSESEEEEGVVEDSEEEEGSTEDDDKDSEEGSSSEEGSGSESGSEVESSRSSSRRHVHRHKSSSSASKKKKKEKKKKKRKKSKHRRREEEGRRHRSSRRSRRGDEEEEEDEEGDTEEEEGDTEGEAGDDTDEERAEMSTPELPEVEEEELILEKEEPRRVREEPRRRDRDDRDDRYSHDKDPRDSRDRRMREGRTRDREEREEPRRRGDREVRETREVREEPVPSRRRGEREEEAGSSRRRRSRSPRDSNRDRDRQHREKQPPRDMQQQESQPEEMPQADHSLGGALPGGTPDTTSLSVDETNKLRASLGLAPLRDGAGEKSKEDTAEHEARAKEFGGTLIPNSNKNEILIPAVNLSEKSLAEKLRDRIAQRREKRKQEAKLMLVKKLGESDDEDEGAAGWIKKQKRAAKEKAAAAKRAKALEELDDEFGVGSMVAEETKKDKAKEYNKNQLRGLKVEHSADTFDSGKSVILTLKDADVLDGDAKDTLVNVNIVDDEKTRKKLDDAKKAKTGYNAYDDEEIDAETGELRRKGMLDKYDEEIDGEMRKAFTIGAKGGYSEEEEVRKQKESIKAKLAATRNLVSLELPKLKVASDYYTAEEAEAKFKKPKKKKKVKRRMLKADDLMPLEDQEGNMGSRTGKKEKTTTNIRAQASSSSSLPMDLDEDNSGSAVQIKTENTLDLSSVKVEEEEDDMGLERALQRARKMKQKKAIRVDPAEALARDNNEESESAAGVDFSSMPTIKTEEERTGSEFISTFDGDGNDDKMIILNETAEFCRNLGARQFNDFADRKMAAKNNVKDEVNEDILDFEESLKSRETRQFEANQRERGRWAVVDDDEDEERRRMDVDDDTDTDTEDNSRASRRKGEKEKKRSAILGEEPDLQNGVAAAIKLASSKGYWDLGEKLHDDSALAHLKSKNYTIDDKMQGRDDDRGRGRDRYNGPTTSFEEKAGYVPCVNLEYIDDGGRLMNQKEAFRYLSHKFHGKTSGKLKTEKRMKKAQEDALMQNMSSTDTPLNTLDKLKKKTKECATPYLVLSGNKINPQDLKK